MSYIFILGMVEEQTLILPLQRQACKRHGSEAKNTEGSRAWIACWLECRTRDRQVVSLNPGRSGGRIFFSRGSFVCRLLFSVRSTPLLPQWHVKDPGHSAKSAGGRLRLNWRTPLTQQSRSGLSMLLSRHSVGTYQGTSSHATCQKTFSHSPLSSLSHCGQSLV